MSIHMIQPASNDMLNEHKKHARDAVAQAVYDYGYKQVEDWAAQSIERDDDPPEAA